MAEGLSHKLNEYLRNGQTTGEDVNPVNCTRQLDQVNQETGLKRTTLDVTQQQRIQVNRRSTLTSFADLYERAVRNVLSIRPLFDSPLDVYAQRRADTNSNNQPANSLASRKQWPENGHQLSEADSENPERRVREDARVPVSQSEYLPSGHNESASRFFTQVLAEQMRYSHARAHSSATQMPGFSGDQAKASNSLATANNPVPSTSRNNSFYDRPHHGFPTHFQHHPGNNYRHHKPGMLDSMKHQPRHHIEIQSRDETKDYVMKTEGDKMNQNKIIKLGNNLSDKPTRLNGLTEAEMESLKEKAKENARLKYRPYSLRSKKTGLRKKFGKGKKKRNKNNRKQLRFKNTWQPQSSQEMFLFGLGLMRKLTDVKTEFQDVNNSLKSE
eukprot:gene259-880_t